MSPTPPYPPRTLCVVVVQAGSVKQFLLLYLVIPRFSFISLVDNGWRLLYLDVIPWRSDSTRHRIWSFLFWRKCFTSVIVILGFLSPSIKPRLQFHIPILYPFLILPWIILERLLFVKPTCDHETPTTSFWLAVQHMGVEDCAGLAMYGDRLLVGMVLTWLDMDFCFDLNCRCPELIGSGWLLIDIYWW